MYIAGASKIVDGVGSHQETNKVRDKIIEKNLRVREYKTATSEMRWSGELPKHYLRSACSPMQAILLADDLFSKDEADVVILSGKDHLKSKYKNKKEERDKHFEIYGAGKSPLTEYNKVAREYLHSKNIAKAEFFKFSEILFQNYLKTWKGLDAKNAGPEKKWFSFISEFFRGLDCANPAVDFSGEIVLAKENSLQKLEIPKSQAIKIVGCDLQQLGEDGPDSISRFISYDHLKNCYENACEKAGINFKEKFLNGDAYLEVYSCYPVVALAFLLSTQMIRDIEAATEFFQEYEVTVTGGLNLGKAAWNCTTLSNIVSMVYKLREGSKQLGGVHGNASLGYQQAFLILQK